MQRMSSVQVMRKVKDKIFESGMTHYLTRSLLFPMTLLFMMTAAIAANPDNQQNVFYTLDFEKNDYAMSDVSRHFFTTFPHDDPTEGDVIYDRKKWRDKNLIQLKKEGLLLSVKEREGDKLFDSVRLTSKSFYNLSDDASAILFVFKGSLPSTNGVWPAWWLNGSRQKEWLYQDADFQLTDAKLDKFSGVGHFYNTPSSVNPTDWPAAGEIDIIETINGHNKIHNTLHTCPQMYDSTWNEDDTIINCANGVPGDPNAGCSGKAYDVDAPEGTFAAIWKQNAIEFFYWLPEENVRSAGGPLNQTPNPENWRKAHLKNSVALLKTEAKCNEKLHEKWQCDSCKDSRTFELENMKMIFNITLCGKWAGAKFDDTENAVQNCRDYILGEGRGKIDRQNIKIEYLSVSRLSGSGS